MTQYYVRTDGNDSNAGTSNTAGGAWLTIQKAANTVVAGDTVNVADGTYAGAISETTSGTSGAHILYKSINKWGAKITTTGVGTSTMFSVSGRYVDIYGFEITGNGIDTAVKVGVALTGGDSSCNGCWVHHIGNVTTCDSNGGAGLLCNQAAGATVINYDFIGNKIHDIGQNCGYTHGIYHQSTGKIQNNIIFNCHGAAHCSHDCENLIISNNTFFNCQTDCIYYSGCTASYTKSPPCPTSGFRIYNNIVANLQSGCKPADGAILSEDVDNELKYNCWYNNPTALSISSNSQATRSNEQNVDPKFKNYQADGTGDYHLTSTSAMIANGFSTYAPATDFDGNVRPNPPSIGAYEYIAPSSSPNVSTFGGRLRKHIR